MCSKQTADKRFPNSALSDFLHAAMSTFKCAGRCTEWDVRLVGGVSESVVREVCVNEMWTPLHPSSEGLSIICRQLGLSNYGII